MSLDHNFFSNNDTQKSSEPFDKKTRFDNGGSDNDDSFHAIALGLIEMFSKHSLLKLREGLLDKLITRHEALFPAHIHEALLDTSASRMQQLIKSIPRSQLVADLAYTLRQIAVDELCTNPTLYPTAFINKNESTSPAQMRRSGTWIDGCCIAALSNRLGLPIIVNVTEPGKILPSQIHYNVDKSNLIPGVSIKLNAQSFIPCHLLSPGPEVNDHLAFNRSTSEIRRMIVDEQLRIKHRYESVRSHLEALNKNELLAIYVSWMNSPDDSNEKKHYAGTEYGYQHFFEAITGDEKTLPTDHDGYVRYEIMNAIARAISVGDMNLDVIYKDNRRSLNL